MLSSPSAFHGPELQRASETPTKRGGEPFSPKANEFFFFFFFFLPPPSFWLAESEGRRDTNLQLSLTASVSEASRDKDKSSFCCRLFLIVMCPQEGFVPN